MWLYVCIWYIQYITVYVYLYISIPFLLIQWYLVKYSSWSPSGLSGPSWSDWRPTMHWPCWAIAGDPGWHGVPWSLALARVGGWQVRGVGKGVRTGEDRIHPWFFCRENEAIHLGLWWVIRLSHATHYGHKLLRMLRPAQDLSWRNAGSQLAKYLTNNLQEEPWKQEMAAKFDEKYEDAPPFAEKI